MGAGLCATNGKEPRLPTVAASLLGPTTMEDEPEGVGELLEEGRMIATIMREIDTGRELYRVAVAEKTPAANVACFAQLSEVARLVLRYFAFRDAFVMTTLKLLDTTAEAAMTDDVVAVTAPSLLPLLRLLVQLAHVCVVIDKQLLEKNLDSSVGLFRRMAANNLNASDPLNVLAMAKTITISLAGPAPTLHDLVEKAVIDATEPGNGNGTKSVLTDAPAGTSSNVGAGSTVDTVILERRIGYVRTTLLLCLSELRQSGKTGGSSGQESLRAFLVVSTALLDALLTRSQRSKGVPLERANGVFAAECHVDIRVVTECIGAGRSDEMLFLRTRLQDNAQKPAETRRKQDEARALLDLRVL